MAAAFADWAVLAHLSEVLIPMAMRTGPSTEGSGSVRFQTIILRPQARLQLHSRGRVPARPVIG